MKQFLTIILATLVGFAATAQDADPAMPQLDVRSAQTVTLGEFLWLNRLIVVFADTDRDPSFRAQMELLREHPGDLIDRDVVVITDTNPATPSDIRNELRPRGFGFVLIDKDGGIKLRKPTPWDVREISRSIDKTDLRQQELRDARDQITTTN